ncbi:enoyl-CoA hydratase/isomerase family protein [Mumia sp. zg.B53]|uniref:enoyl-CoA hydratase-related protein n=1 Tax=unclassified Mumia TaxID=2621872 RepID=UPI001C6E010B|nr:MULTISPECIES: enoyl-CoA hydratase-related protein [unclassified Mumia]MBW9206790.1 enoyl-CoA hydratase/isomerase family protein [Mumia sp. zg.B17]MBW9210922.1 enoyl-CoA hydratase/isomerase family protein [Mumia sp. zg.B21]MBW9215488.1 enoyl-CoA hydratase/isomerase family protein [Mumia sp. zg.B53]MDD9348828.1 enoyl-CoA hydratase-related protein [Mumia sp.]
MTEPHPAVAYEVADGVATITLSRPDVLNSFDDLTKVAFRDSLHAAAADEAVRCVVLTGSGRAFSAGQDLKEHVAKMSEGGQLSNTVEEHFNPMVLAITTMPKPVIAAVNGIAAGAGASIAFAADFRIVAESAGFNLAFAGIALSADTGASWTLQRLVGLPKATELLLLPRTVRAEEALALGLATQVVPDDAFSEAVADLAQRLATGPTLAYASLKRALAFSATHSLPESLTNEARLMALTGASEDHGTAVKAFLAKEQPTFVGR